MIRSLFGGSKCRTVDVCDIFGDGSGKALYRLDGNANDESGNYHGTETAVTYGGGVYERGAVFTAANSSKITTPSIPITTTFSVSWWVKSANTSRSVNVQLDGNNSIIFYYRVDNNTIEITTDHQYTCPSNTTGEYYDGNWHLLTLTYDGTNTKFYKDTAQVTLTQGAVTTKSTTITTIGGRNSVGGYYWNGTIDQVRIFNRALIATEIATLYAECAPTSTVTDINPFLDSSLKAMYSFENNANDDTGVYNGTATNITYSTGKFGQASLITAGRIDLGSKLLVPSTSSYSVSTWMKKVASQRNILFSRDNGTSAYGDMLFFDGTAKTFYFQFPSAVTTATGQTTPATTIFDDNAFHLVSFVVNRSTLVAKIYIDANLFYTGTTLASSYDNNLNVFIGGNPAGSTVNYYGNFDQLRFFNKALTPMEVSSLYCETTPLEEPLHSLVDPFKDGSGKALYRLEGNALDESGNYNGTANSITYGTGTLYGREAIFNGSASISATLSLTANTFSYSIWATVTTISSTIQSLIDFSTGRAMLSSGNGTDSKLSYYDGTAYRTFGTYSLTNATKTHIGLAVNGTSVELFINGVSQGTSACSAVTPSGNLYLGRYAGSVAGYLTGREDQVRIFSRVLTASEFQNLYTQGA